MKKNKFKIGIVGFGFIGRAIAHGFVLHADIKVYDKYENVYESLDETVNESDFIFVGVPTPTDDNGRQDLVNINDAVENIVKVARERKIIILKSTIIPGTTRKCAEKYPQHDFVFNPEFLTERSAKLDFINPARIILGGESEVVEKVEELYKYRFYTIPIFKTTFEGAEFVKYMCNGFFAMKISFLNECYDIAEKIGIDFNDLRDMWLSDSRIGNSHIDVPGHDGKRGFSGKCFVKDVKAIYKWTEENDYNFDMMKVTDEVNERIRGDEDWKKIKGASSSYNYKEE